VLIWSRTMASTTPSLSAWRRRPVLITDLKTYCTRPARNRRDLVWFPPGKFDGTQAAGKGTEVQDRTLIVARSSR
jgi:hypothetical protein